jgi:sigma-B regulation protein RsbU (phosphoserine phosphatase)
MAVAIDNAHLYRSLKREALEKDLLYEVGKKLSSSLNLDETLETILNSLRQVIEYNVGGVFLVDPERNEVKSIYTVGYDKGVDEKMQLKIGQGLIGQAATSGEPVIVPDVTKDSHYINAHSSTRSEIVVPIKAGERLIGVINLESDSLNAYDQRSVALITAFASQAAISLERATLHERQLSQKSLEEQLKIARSIQRDFLPAKSPQIPGYDLAGRNISLGQVGGDYYDFIRIVDSQTGIAIADVSGKGIPASLIMAAFRASLIAEIRNNYSIRTIMEKANRLLCESLEPGNFVTAVYGVLDSKNHIFTYANCGHNLPILLRSNGDVEFLREGGPVLGVSRDGIYQEQALMLHHNEIIVFYTDGVTEAFNNKEEEFGMDRLVDVVRSNRQKSAAEIQEQIYRAVKSFASDRNLLDDLTMVVVKRLPK